MSADWWSLCDVTKLFIATLVDVCVPIKHWLKVFKVTVEVMLMWLWSV